MHWIAVQPAPEADVAAGTAGASGVVGAVPALVDVGTALAWWALRFTPMVARVETALVLEVSGSERLFGGRSALLQRLFATEPPVVALDHAQGATALLALARLWSQTPDAPIDSLPLHTLAAARAHLPTLVRLGCSSWGQLRALPRGGLVRRFGAGLVDALDQAYGARPELYPWLTLPEVFDAPLELSAAVETAPALLFGARRLLAQLLVWLRARQRGVLALELLWELDARRSNALHVDAHHQGTGQGRLELRTAQATQDMQHLQRLLGEQLAQVSLPAPVLYLRLRTVQTQALAGESRGADHSGGLVFEGEGALDFLELVLGVGGVLGVGHGLDDLHEQRAGFAGLVLVFPVHVHEARGEKGGVLGRPFALERLLEQVGGGLGIAEVLALELGHFAEGEGVVRVGLEGFEITLHRALVVAAGEGRHGVAVRVFFDPLVRAEKEIADGVAHRRHDYRHHEDPGEAADEHHAAEVHRNLAHVGRFFFRLPAGLGKNDHGEPDEGDGEEEAEEAHGGWERRRM